MSTNSKETDIRESKRQVELSQLETRYKSTYKVIEDAETETIVRLAIRPTDPDFPFELHSLQLQLHIPIEYPSSSCRIEVINNDIPKGFAINLERGYKEYAKSSQLSIVKQMNWLDRNLEKLLQQAPAATLRFVSHVVTEDTRHLEYSDTTRPLTDKQIRIHEPQQAKKSVSHQPPVSSKSHISQKAAPALCFLPQTAPSQPQLVVPQHTPQIKHETEKYTEEQKKTARIKRQHEIQQLETRFCDSFKMRTNDTISLLVQVNDVDFNYDLRPLQLKYTIPVLYPLDSCSIDVENKNLDETRKSWVRHGFDQHDVDLSLFEKLNWMNRHLQSWLTTPVKVEEKKSKLSASAPSFVPSFASSSSSGPAFVPRKDKDTKKSKVVVVNDPSLLVDDSEDTESDYDSEESYSEDEKDPEEEQITSAQPLVKRGTEIRLVQPTLDNVALFRCHLLCVIVQCARCKHTTAVDRIQPEKEDKQASHTKSKSEQWFACPTCSSLIGVKFFGELVHQGMSSLGLLQLAGCTVQDILPSTFLGTCSQCMTDMTSPLSLSFHTSPQTSSCFQCHARMTVGLNAYRLVRLGGERLTVDPSQAMTIKRKKRREEGLVIGEPLSNQGTCSHYRKSKRWFRFPCCHKLYPCDVCHDSREDHSYEMARRHVCGLCSREQSIVIGKPCACGQEFEKTVHKGAFWEGGKGVRNKEVMSRKDPHKHKGIGKTTSKKQERVGVSGKEHAQDHKKQ